MPRWIEIAGPVLISVFCLGTLGAGLWFLFDALRFRRNAVRGTGEVIRINSQWQDITESDDSGSHTRRALVYYPVIAYEDSWGSRYNVQSHEGNLTQLYRVGQTVPILFAGDNHEKMRIDSFGSFFAVPICLLVIGTGAAGFLAFWLLYVP